MTGHPDFERRLRVQQNMVEQLVLFLPAMWMFATTISELWAAILGFVFCVGRAVYSVGYYASAPRRAPGFGIAALATIILLLGALIGTVRLVVFGI